MGRNGPPAGERDWRWFNYLAAAISLALLATLFIGGIMQARRDLIEWLR